MNLFWFDDDEAVNKVRIDSPNKELLLSMAYLQLNDIQTCFILCMTILNPNLLGKPRLQILMPSSTPLQVNWCITSAESSNPGVLWLFGTMHRMKWGSVWFRVVRRASSWALKAEDTVLKVFGPASLPFFFSFPLLGSSSGWPG